MNKFLDKIVNIGKTLNPVLLVGLWLVYLGFLGPTLISASSTISVLIGLSLFVGLVHVTYFRIDNHFTGESNE